MIEMARGGFVYTLFNRFVPNSFLNLRILYSTRVQWILVEKNRLNFSKMSLNRSNY